MMDLVPPLTHVAAFVLGVATWFPFTKWEGRRVTHPEDAPHRYHRRRVSLWVVVLLAAAALLIGFGIQQALYQSGASDRDACYETWGQEMVDSVKARSGATGDLQVAQTRRDNAVDHVFGLVIRERKIKPPPPQKVTERRFDRALDRFAKAKQNLRQRTADAVDTRSSNPFPTLHCG